MKPVGVELLTELVDQHGAALVLYARQWCDTPEDVVQDAFLLLVRQPKAPENAVGWLYRVVRNGAISASRSAARRARREASAGRRDPPWFSPSRDDWPDADAVTRALQGLSPEEREAIVARIWGGLTWGQIAGLAGSTKSTVHRRYQSGLVALRERLGVRCPETKSMPRN